MAARFSWSVAWASFRSVSLELVSPSLRGDAARAQPGARLADRLTQGGQPPLFGRIRRGGQLGQLGLRVAFLGADRLLLAGAQLRQGLFLGGAEIVHFLGPRRRGGSGGGLVPLALKLLLLLTQLGVMRPLTGLRLRLQLGLMLAGGGGGLGRAFGRRRLLTVLLLQRRLGRCGLRGILLALVFKLGSGLLGCGLLCGGTGLAGIGAAHGADDRVRQRQRRGHEGSDSTHQSFTFNSMVTESSVKGSGASCSMRHRGTSVSWRQPSARSRRSPDTRGGTPPAGCGPSR